MKYLIVCDSAEINGGCSKVAIQTAVGLAKCGKEVIFFAGGGDNDPNLNHKNITIVNLKMKNLISGNKVKMFVDGVYNKKSKKEMIKLLTKLDLSKLIIHVHSWVKTLSPSIFDAFKKFNCKFFITIHDYFLACPNGGFFNYPKCKICKMNKVSLKCLTCNCDSRKYIYKIWRWFKFKKQQKCLKKCKYYLIDISLFTQKYVHLNELNRYLLKNPIEMNYGEQLPNPQNGVYAFIGRLTREKGIELFCSAMAKTGYEAYVYGSGQMLNKLKMQYINFRNIHFVGWLSTFELKEEYKRIKALIFPSMWYEGAPLSIPEVQSYGIPCIVSDACSGKDYIYEGVNGFIFKDNNLESLIEKINLFEKNKDYKTIRNDTYNIALNENNTEKKYIDELLEIYCKN